MTAEREKVDSLQAYRRALIAMDVATCEAAAVSQRVSGRMAAPYAGYATTVFTRVCVHATALMKAAPLSRWARSEFYVWDLSSVAAQARAIFEGDLLLEYIARPPESDEEWIARLNVMHLNDCCRRIKLMGYLGGGTQADQLREQGEEIRDQLRANDWFAQLEPHRQKSLLTGESLTIEARDSLLVRVGWDKDEFRAIWLLLSQYIHILPLSFYRMEPNGRGTGVHNDTDQGYLCMILGLCAQSVGGCTDRIVKLFPDAALVRNGTRSKFTPGPAANRPKHSRI